MKGFIATGQRVALDKLYLESIPILKPVQSFQVVNSSSVLLVAASDDVCDG